MSISGSASRASTVAVTAAPLTKARERPSALAARAHEAIALGFVVERLLLAKHRQRLRLPRDVELRTHIAASRAGANLHPARPRTEHQREGIEQDGLAGAGLAGDHREAGTKLDVESIHQHEVANG